MKYKLVKHHNFQQYGGAKILMDEVYHDTLAVFSKFELEDISSWDGNKQILDVLTKMNIKYFNMSSRMWSQDLLKIYMLGSNYVISIIENLNVSSTTSIINDAIDAYYGKTNPAKPTVEFLIDLDNKLNQLELNLLKGGNYIGLPITYIIDRNNKQQLQIKQNLSSPYCLFGLSICLDRYNNFDFTNIHNANIIHIDEIACVMPYGPSRENYKLWFYKPVLSEKILEADRDLIKKNHINNRKIIASIIGEDKIVDIPLYFISDTNTLPPIFNRICLKNKNRYYFIFPKVNCETEQIVNQEIINISTALGDCFDVRHMFINTTRLHQLNGNLHCFYKTMGAI